MTTLSAHEGHVYARFDSLEARFRADVDVKDFRVDAIRRSLGLRPGTRILDLGCGKGRFASRLRSTGVEVFGVDISAGMLAGGVTSTNTRASIRRLPFAEGSFDAAFAVEVFQHLPASAVGAVLAEARRVLRPGGRLAVLDRNRAALDADRPWLPRVALKRLDERRGRWMYDRGGPVRERWFGAGALRRRVAEHFRDATAEFLLSPSEARHAVFRRLPAARSMVLWSGVARG